MASVVRKGKAGAVYIGRPSIFGNPFVIGRDGSRADVISKFEAYCLERLDHDSAFRAAVYALKGKDLACYCAPQACHGDVLLRIAND